VSDMRDTRDGPWAWQSKVALRAIREAFDRTNDVASAIGVYVTLTEIASDAGSDRFHTTHAWIQRLSGWSVRTVQARLKTLAEIGLIEVETPDLRAPSTYTLKAVAQPLPNVAQPLPNVRQLAKQASLPTSEESTEERKKKGASRFSPPTIEEVLLHAAKIGLPETEAKKLWHFYDSKGWKVGKAPMRNWHSAMSGWKVRWETERGKPEPPQNCI